MGDGMDMQMATSDLDEDEKMKYIDSTASEYFRSVYYSKQFSKIVEKLNSKENLSKEEWDYLMRRLFMVTYKASMEEDELGTIDKINYIINKICIKVLRRGRLYSESVKMLASLESNRLANEINNDLFAGMERVEESMDVADMNLLLKQHREALIFRDNKKAFMDSYKKGRTGVITSDELLFMDLMDRAYIREKNLVKEYK